MPKGPRHYTVDWSKIKFNPRHYSCDVRVLHKGGKKTAEMRRSNHRLREAWAELDNELSNMQSEDKPDAAL